MAYAPVLLVAVLGTAPRRIADAPAGGDRGAGRGPLVASSAYWMWWAAGLARRRDCDGRPAAGGRPAGHRVGLAIQNVPRDAHAAALISRRSPCSSSATHMRRWPGTPTATRVARVAEPTNLPRAWPSFFISLIAGPNVPANARGELTFVVRHVIAIRVRLIVRIIVTRDREPSAGARHWSACGGSPVV
jgi:hypothetical protein